MKFLRMNSECMRESEAVSTGTEIITSLFRWWEELMQYMLRHRHVG